MCNYCSPNYDNSQGFCFPCSGNGDVDNPTLGTCKCHKGYSGDKCDVECSGHGKIDQTSGNCQCQSGWSGDMCEKKEGCENGKTSCNGICVDTLTDINNCGSCGNICSSNSNCLSGKCTPLCTPNCTKNCGQSNGCGGYCPTTALDKPNVQWILTGTSKPAIQLGTYDQGVLSNNYDIYIFYNIIDENTVQITRSQYSSPDPPLPIKVGDIFKFNISTNIYTHTKYPNVQLIQILCESM